MLNTWMRCFHCGISWCISRKMAVNVDMQQLKSASGEGERDENLSSSDDSMLNPRKKKQIEKKEKPAYNPSPITPKHQVVRGTNTYVLCRETLNYTVPMQTVAMPRSFCWSWH